MGMQLPKQKGHRNVIQSKGLIRTRGEMNKTEGEYAATLEADPRVVWWRFEPFTLRLSHPDSGQPLRYTPDFLVLYEDGLTCVDDAKHQFRDYAGDVRIKAAAELYPLWVFRLAVRRREKDGGGFEIREV